MELPSLATALAVARLVQARTSKAVTEALPKLRELEVEVEQLRAAAAAPPAPQPPLLQVVADIEAPTDSMPGPADRDALQRQICSLAMWHEAAAALPPDLQPVLARAQRYALLCQLQQASSSSGLLAGALLERSPIRALLELAIDILQTHASALGATSTPSEQNGRSMKLTAAHNELLLAACACLVRLCDLPGKAALHSDYSDLQQFCALVLQLAAAPALEHVVDMGTPGHQVQQQQEQPEAPQPGLPELNGQAALPQACAQLAQQVLGVLRQSASAGTVLLGCLAPQTRDCMGALVAAITGEHLLGGFMTGLSGSCSTLGGSSSAMGDPAGQPGWGGEAEERRLLHAFMQLSQQLSLVLRLLPQWMQTLDSCSDGFLQVIRKSNRCRASV
jgi:hypothetical protein